MSCKLFLFENRRLNKKILVALLGFLIFIIIDIYHNVLQWGNIRGLNEQLMNKLILNF